MSKNYSVLKTYFFIKSKEQYFITLLNYYCKKKHKKNNHSTVCYNCEEFYYAFEKSNFDTNSLRNYEKKKYNQVLNSADLFFKCAHFLSFKKYHNLFTKINNLNE